MKALRTHLPSAFLDCHLMVSDPLFWVEEFGKSGASQFTFHIEAVDNNTAKAFEVIHSIKQHNMKAWIVFACTPAFISPICVFEFRLRARWGWRSSLARAWSCSFPSARLLICCW